MKNVGKFARSLPVLGVAAVLLAALHLAASHLASPVTAYAQQAATAPADTPQLSTLTVVQVRPDKVAEWENLQKTEVMPAQQKGGFKSRQAWRTAAFGDAAQYAFTRRVDSLAEYDEDPPLVKALGQDGARALSAKTGACIVWLKTSLMRRRSDLSFGGGPNDPMPKLVLATQVHVAQGRQRDFESAVTTDIIPALKKAQVSGYYVSETVLGGEVGVYMTILPYNTFAEIGKGHPLEIGLGPEGMARLMQKLSGTVLQLERRVWRHVPELSYPQSAKTSE